jgi:hypothetical protein
MKVFHAIKNGALTMGIRSLLCALKPLIVAKSRSPVDFSDLDVNLRDEEQAHRAEIFSNVVFRILKRTLI